MAAPICFICTSPYRDEVMELHKKGVSANKILIKYRDLMGYPSSVQAFGQMIKRHLKNRHIDSAVVIPMQTGKLRPATIESFGQRMMELGMAKIEAMTPGQVQLKDVIAAQKLVLDSKKLKLSEDAFTVMMGKLFGPKLDQAIDGETV